MSSIQTSGDIRTNYMTLLVTQLQNQNPLEPMDNDQMASQLAQLSQLEQAEQLNTTFDKVLSSQLLTQATGLIGRSVGWLDQDTQEALWAQVTAAGLSESGEVVVKTDRGNIALDKILSVAN